MVKAVLISTATQMAATMIFVPLALS